MERSPRAATAIADTVMFVVVVGLAGLAAVMPVVVIAVGLPALLIHGLVGRRLERRGAIERPALALRNVDQRSASRRAQAA